MTDNLSERVYRHYKAFHLHFETPFACPELLPVGVEEAEALERVVVRFDRVPEHLNHPVQQWPVFESNENEVLLKIEGVGNFLIRNGNEIVIEKEDGCSAETLRLYLFGSAVGALLQQRGYLTLHASAIKTDKGAVLFAGDSGAGKSTTLQAFLRRGYQKLSDDTIALYYDETRGEVICLPSYPQSKIWQKTADLFDHDTTQLRQLHPEMDKYALSTREHFYDHVLPLHAIYLLQVSNEVDEVMLEEVRGMDKFKAVNDNTYRNFYSYKLPYRQEHFKIAERVSRGYRIVHVRRPSETLTVNDVCDLMELNLALTEQIE
ncbi:MAG: hypothetical protein PHS85_09825 [Sulfurovum sp.]|nr:hypothetical protein [Sulfurovum sp.]